MINNSQVIQVQGKDCIMLDCDNKTVTILNDEGHKIYFDFLKNYYRDGQNVFGFILGQVLNIEKNNQSIKNRGYI